MGVLADGFHSQSASLAFLAKRIDAQQSRTETGCRHLLIIHKSEEAGIRCERILRTTQIFHS